MGWALLNDEPDDFESPPPSRHESAVIDNPGEGDTI